MNNRNLLLAALLGFIVTLPHWLPGYPASGDRTDTWGHIARATIMADAMHSEGFLRGFLNTHWVPDWYMGDLARVYYPPLAVDILGPLIYLTGDPFVGYKVFISLASTILGALVYLFSARLWRNKSIGLLSSILAVTAPHTLNILYIQGNMPRVLALLPLPVLAWSIEGLLTGKKLRHPFILASLAWAFAALSHSQQAIVYMICFALYVVLRLLTDMLVGLRRSILPFVTMAFGLGISAPYWMPAYLGGEINGVPYLPGDTIIRIFTTRWSNFLPAFWQDPGEIVIPIGMLCLATIAVLARPKPIRKAWYGVSIVAILLSLGLNGPLYPLLPFNTMFMPDRFLDISVIILPMIAAGLLPLGSKGRLPRAAIIAGLVALDSVPVFHLILPHPWPADSAFLAERLATEPDDGRLLHLLHPEPFASDIYMGQIVAGKDLVMGWNLPNTPTHFAVRRAIYAAEYYPAYFQRLLSLWNVRYIMLRPPSDEPTYAQDALRTAGFSRLNQHAGTQLWINPMLGAPLKALVGNQMLVIGDNLTSWLAAFPWAGEGYSPDLGDYDRAYLNRFRVIGLARFQGDSPENLARLEDWVAGGGILIVDLSGIGSAYEQGYSFMGVQAMPVSIFEEHALRWTKELENMPVQANFKDETTGGPWSGASYIGLDNTIVEVDKGNNASYPLVGYKNIGQGRVWFISLNYLYYLDINQDFEARDQLAGYLINSAQLNTDLALPPIESSSLQANWHSASLLYTAGQPATAVLSMTYTPRWQATLDGVPITIHNYNRLMLLDLPAGEHQLNFRYSPSETLWPRIGLVVGIASLELLMLVALLGLRRSNLVPNHVSGQAENLPVTAHHSKEWLTTCPNCHFKLAAGGPPNGVTYPFNVIRCAVCGYRLDEYGFEAGKIQSQDQRLAIARNWIRSQGWELDSLPDRFGFGPDELFETEMAEHLPAVPPFFSIDAVVSDKEPPEDKLPDSSHRGKVPPGQDKA
ncbi:MAG: hypothetical protein JXB30_14145 [Anaerolineae bacterium]|nr:hypothetical protein [Anaerolineae bacterium]